jgi:hypothetical protein
MPIAMISQSVRDSANRSSDLGTGFPAASGRLCGLVCFVDPLGHVVHLRSMNGAALRSSFSLKGATSNCCRSPIVKVTDNGALLLSRAPLEHLASRLAKAEKSNSGIRKSSSFVANVSFVRDALEQRERRLLAGVGRHEIAAERRRVAHLDVLHRALLRRRARGRVLVADEHGQASVGGRERVDARRDGYIGRWPEPTRRESWGCRSRRARRDRPPTCRSGRWA